MSSGNELYIRFDIDITNQNQLKSIHAITSDTQHFRTSNVNTLNIAFANQIYSKKKKYIKNKNLQFGLEKYFISHPVQYLHKTFFFVYIFHHL